METKRKIIVPAIKIWLIVFATGTVWESVIRVHILHDSWSASNSLSFVAVNLGLSILLAILLGWLHSLLLLMIGRGGKYREKLQVLVSPTVGVAVAAFLVAPALSWQIRNNIPLKSMITVAVCVTIYLACIILVRLFARLLPRISELRMKETIIGLVIVPVVGILALQLVRGSRLMIKEQAKGPIRYVVLISIDTLRHDYVGVYGATETQTPNMDRAAKEGALYRVAVSPVPQT